MVTLATDSHSDPQVQATGRIIRYHFSIIGLLSVQFFALGLLALILGYKPTKYGLIVFGFLAIIELAALLFGHFALTRMRPIYWALSTFMHLTWLILVIICMIVLSVTDADASFETEICLHVAAALWGPIGVTLFFFQYRMIRRLGILRDGKLNLKTEDMEQ